MTWNRRFSKSRGFSLFELIIVVAIILVLSGIATPTMFRAIRSYQLEAAGRQVGNMILRARYEAMQRNRRVCAAFQRVGGEGRYGLDLFVNGNPNAPTSCNEATPTLDANESYIYTNNHVNWWFNDNPGPFPSQGLPPGIAGAVAPPRYRVVFSPRGTVVQPGAGGTWQMATTVSAICLVRNIPNDFDAVLVTVTPVGRIKLYRWRWNTTRWEEL